MLGNLASLRPRYRKLFALGALIGLIVLPVGTALRAEEGERAKGEGGGDRALRLLTLAPIPASKANHTAGGMYSFDISFVDQKTQTYYLGDRSNAAVDVVGPVNVFPEAFHTECCCRRNCQRGNDAHRGEQKLFFHRVTPLSGGRSARARASATVRPAPTHR